MTGAVPACLPPAAWVRSSLKGGVARIIACRGGIPLRPVPGGIVVSPPVSDLKPGTNTTSTNPGPSPATMTETTLSPATTTNAGATTDTGTQTNPGATTDTGTQTNSGATTDTGTQTNPGATTDTGTTPSSTRVGPSTLKFVSPLVRACRLAGRAATR